MMRTVVHACDGSANNRCGLIAPIVNRALDARYGADYLAGLWARYFMATSATLESQVVRALNTACTRGSPP